MDKLTDLILNYSSNNKLVSRRFIEETYNYLRRYYSVEDFVKDLHYYDYNRSCPYSIYYIPHEKKLL